MMRELAAMTEYELVSPRDPHTWSVYHVIRREVLFEARGLFGVYDENRPDERAPGNHAKLLLVGGAPVGVIRIDISGNDATFRRVAIRLDAQRRGHGRTMLSLAEAFAAGQECTRILSHVAPDAVVFYEKCGFTREGAVASSGDEAVLMAKHLA
jgi:GNAT superfamily N-acetyltransferase